MRRLLGLAVIAGFSFTSFAADTHSTDQPTKVEKKKKEDKKKDKKKDPDEIGNRDVGRGPNFYSLEKEIALGKQLAQEVERQAKIIDDPIIAEYVNRVGQNIVRNSDARFLSLSKWSKTNRSTLSRCRADSSSSTPA